MNLRSGICRGTVTHQRLSPAPHAFTYPSTFFAFDLAELEKLEASIAIFSYNKRNLLSLNDRDFLYGKPTKIAAQLNALLGPRKENERTLLISSPRYFGYAFNPVNFHLRMAGNQLLSVVAEVNNTFGDRHVYPLKRLDRIADNTWTASCPKAFHVSPFNNMAGEYHFTFTIDDQRLFMGVDLHRDGQCVLKTWLEGKPKPVTAVAIAKYALLRPFDTALNSMPRILWQAAQLYYRKHLQVYTRPSPISAATLIDRNDKDKPVTIV